MKNKITCPKCQGKKFFETGPLAKHYGKWNCPKCDGVGEFEIGLIRQLFLSFALYLDNLINIYTRDNNVKPKDFE